MRYISRISKQGRCVGKGWATISVADESSVAGDGKTRKRWLQSLITLATLGALWKAVG